MRSLSWRLHSLTPFLAAASITACAVAPAVDPLDGPAMTLAAPAGAVEAPTTFENPGGMWMPGQMAEHAAALRELGLAYDPAGLMDPTSFPLGAVVSLGGCSASFVSPDGLIVTNHHCVGGALQYNSTAESNLLVEGFLAKDRESEMWAGPTKRVYVTTSFKDVTQEVLAGTHDVDDNAKRSATIRQNRKDLTAACESGKSDTRCRVASFFEGAQFFQIEQLEIRDIRLVYAPHEGVGVFGGEIDNWRWPRHTGDYSFLRAYVGPDGKPADHDVKNVPYHPPHHLKVATQGVSAGDLVMVAGYPGRTNRLKTADEVESATRWYYPRAIARREQYIAVLEAVTKDDPALSIKAAGTLRSLNNGLTNNRGMLEGLDRGGLAKARAGEEAKLIAWINADEARRKRFGGVLEAIAELNMKSRRTRDADAASRDLLSASTLLGRAFLLIEMAEARPKKDAERESWLQERNWPRLTQRLEASAKKFDPRIDRAVFRLMLERAVSLPENSRPEALAKIVGERVDGSSIEDALDKLYAKTRLDKTEVVISQLHKATSTKLARSKDPFMKLAFTLREIQKNGKQRAEIRAGAMAKLRPAYIAALREFKGGTLAPDANSTLRITYGTVRGYSPAPGKPVYEPFTWPSEMVAKHTGETPFAAPSAVLAAVQKGNFGPYAAESGGEAPLDFLADLDITGGNSGSAALNAKGELVGLAFDGNYEAMASDWIFIPAITRSIQVDIRYVLWIMDAVDGADALLLEMGVTPSID